MQVPNERGHTMIDLTTIVSGVVLTKACGIKPDKDSSDTKQVTLKVKFDGVSLQAVFDKAMSSTVISWQNGQGRSKFDSWIDKGTVEVNFKAPATAPTIDPESAMVAKLQAMDSDEDRAKYIKEVLLRKSNLTLAVETIESVELED